MAPIGWRCLVGLLVALQTGCQLARPVSHTTELAAGPAATTTIPGEAAAPKAPLPEVIPAAYQDSAEPAAELPAEPIRGQDGWPSSVDAVDSAAANQTWTLESLQSAALQWNPAIQQAGATTSKARGFRNQVTRRANPTVAYNGTQLADAGTDQHTALVEQELILGRKLQWNSRVHGWEISSMQWAATAQQLKVLTDVRQVYYDLLADQMRLQLASEFEQVAEKGVKTAAARLESLEGHRPELLQSEVQLEQIRLMRQQVEASLRADWRRLAALVGLPDLEAGRVDGSLDVPTELPDWDLLATTWLADSPELQGARARLERARANVQRQIAQTTPNLTWMVAAGQDNGTDSGMINTQIGMPLMLHNQNQGNIAAARAEYCRQLHNLRRTESLLQARLAEASKEFESAARAVQQYRDDILPRVAESLKLIEQAYTAGEFDFLQVYVARRAFFESNLEYITAQARLAKAAALIDGMLLTGGLDDTPDTELDAGLRDQSLGGQ